MSSLVPKPSLFLFFGLHSMCFCFHVLYWTLTEVQKKKTRMSGNEANYKSPWQHHYWAIPQCKTDMSSSLMSHGDNQLFWCYPGSVSWYATSHSEELLFDVALSFLQIVTFDEGGVSGHPNHVAISKAVRSSMTLLLYRSSASFPDPIPHYLCIHTLDKL